MTHWTLEIETAILAVHDTIKKEAVGSSHSITYWYDGIQLQANNAFQKTT